LILTPTTENSPLRLSDIFLSLPCSFSLGQEFRDYSRAAAAKGNVASRSFAAAKARMRSSETRKNSFRLLLCLRADYGTHRESFAHASSYKSFCLHQAGWFAGGGVSPAVFCGVGGTLIVGAAGFCLGTGELGGGGAPVNKYFENRSFDSTETMFCRLSKKAVLNVVLEKLEAKVASAQSLTAVRMS
jgi:hypothetical protein